LISDILYCCFLCIVLGRMFSFVTFNYVNTSLYVYNHTVSLDLQLRGAIALGRRAVALRRRAICFKKALCKMCLEDGVCKSNADF
jgi:hypothetical protein